MVQKVIKIGTSAGVTIPKKHLDELGISVGDEVELSIKKHSAKGAISPKFHKDLDAFMDSYAQDLKNLASR